MNPNDFIITRKRKKYKFALFYNASNCFELAQWQKSSDTDVVEIGAGNAHFLVELASRHADKNFVAIDVKADRLQSGARMALSQDITNIKFVRARADQVTEMFEPGTMSNVWLTFSDPFPRKRSAGRRMTHRNFLSKYKSILKPDGTLLIKHDNREFFCWSLEQLIDDKWHINQLSFDLHESDLCEDYKILTAYEKRWLNAGLTTSFVSAVLK